MRKKRYKKKSPIVLIITLITIIVLILGIIIFFNIKERKKSNYDENILLGTFWYEEGKTKYIFKENGTGCMSSDNFDYDYKYSIDGNILAIDFVKNEVHDIKYTFMLNNGILKLVSKEGAVSIGEEYILKKENK